MPEDAESPLILFDFLHSIECVVHAEELVIFGDQLCRFSFGLAKDYEVLYEVE